MKSSNSSEALLETPRPPNFSVFLEVGRESHKELRLYEMSMKVNFLMWKDQ